MRPLTIGTIVEGQGEVQALPVVLRRIAARCVPETWLDLPRPYRAGRGSLLKAGGIEAAVTVVAEANRVDGVLVVIDADDDCPATLGPGLLRRAQECRPDKQHAVVLANREFEAWFLAAAPSLGGVRGLAEHLDLPAEPERPRDCKGWLTSRRTDGQSYKPTADQAALADRFDLDMARAHSPSFDKFYRDVERLLTKSG
ncbi:DUF4276 family protein [Actinomadura craniellae]|nr:DUF4276 family protein [Actinomadura craniellae]